MTLTFDQFVATKNECDDETWQVLVDENVAPASRESVHVYADAYCIHVENDLFHVHAWWYSPQPYDTLAIAETRLYDWYLEWAS